MSTKRGLVVVAGLVGSVVRERARRRRHEVRRTDRAATSAFASAARRCRRRHRRRRCRIRRSSGCCKYGFSRNENLIKAQLTLSISDRVKAVADIDFYWYGYSDVNDIDAATLHERVDPYRLEANAAYVDIYKILPQLDLRIGRQVVVWGTGDKFNPTNNLNTLDLSDPLLFGKAIANNMIRADWNPWGDLILTAVWVPIFRPAQLPRTAPLAVTTPNRPAPVQEEYIRSTLGSFAQAMPPTQINVFTMQPDPSIDNSQVGVRVAGRFVGLDMSASYYHGRWGIPTPAWAVQKPNGVVDAIVMWPRMDVLGADMAGSIEKLKGLGYWVEAGAVLPAEDHLRHLQRRVRRARPDHVRATRQQGRQRQRACSARTSWRPSSSAARSCPSTPFFKLTAGMDFTWNKYLYSNLQYVYGFIDEFGAGQAVLCAPTDAGVRRLSLRGAHRPLPRARQRPKIVL